jgi:transglutaminase/protease-like cytokinesis protein 3
MKSLSNYRYLINGTTESDIFEQNEIYQLIPPYQLILIEEKTTKNGTSIINKTEKKGDFYISSFTDGRNVKVDTLIGFQYSLNEDWAKFLFGIDTISQINTVLEAADNMDFETHKSYKSYTKLVKREKKLKNGVYHSYITTDYSDELGNIRLDIIDEYLTYVEIKIADYSLRIEPKEVAMNLNTIHDLFFNCNIPIDIDFCQVVPRYDSLLFTKVLFEIESDKNPFDTTNNQSIEKKNGKLFLEMNYENPVVSKAKKNEIIDNLKETDFYPIHDTLIINMAKEATKMAKTRKKKVDLLIKYVHEYIKYSKDDYSQHFISVYDIIRTKNGVCSDFAELFTVLARSIGIPCKTVVGYALDPNDGYLGGHKWNEVEINGFWYGVDPTWNLWLPSHYHFKQSNADLSCKELNSILLKLRSITLKNGKTISYY